jgi:hypothetical protein
LSSIILPRITNINTVDVDSKSAISYAISSFNVSLVTSLLECGARLNTCTKDDKMTPLMQLITAPEPVQPVVSHSYWNR